MISFLQETMAHAVYIQGACGLDALAQKTLMTVSKTPFDIAR